MAIGASTAVAASVAPRAEGITIELRPSATISQTQVHLGDIANLTSGDLELLRRMMGLQIGAAPKPGALVLIDREAIVRWVDARSGGTAIRWRGASETRIESAAQQLAGETIVDAARTSLTRWLAERSVRAEVSPVSSPRDLILPAGATTLRVRPLTTQAMPSRRMLVWVDAWVDERFVRTAAVSFEVSAWTTAEVVVSDLTRRAAMDAIVARGALQEREVDLTTLRGRPVVPRGSSAGEESQRLRRPLRAGEVLTQAHLEAAPAVARGDWANLLSRSGDVSIESRVEILQDGRPDDMVRVKVPGASGEVFAKVTGRGRVEVQP